VFDFALAERVAVGENDFAVHAESRRNTRNEMEIGGVKIAGGSEQSI
jgi:hypothetical protein